MGKVRPVLMSIHSSYQETRPTAGGDGPAPDQTPLFSDTHGSARYFSRYLYCYIFLLKM